MQYLLASGWSGCYVRAAMQLVNDTRMQAGYSMGTRPDGRELLVVVVKATFTIPRAGEEPLLAETQQPLAETDVFTGEPGFSAPLYENDFAPHKPFCDVLLNGSAYAPHGAAMQRVRVALRIGSWSKSFDVVGNRTWRAGPMRAGSSGPEPFTVMPISYNNAFGGVDRYRRDERQHRFFADNHAGVGYHHYQEIEAIEFRPLPNTEEIDRPVTAPDGNYRPMAFGPLGRSWKQRIRYGGTYDQEWIDRTFPFLPANFDDRYYQSAPDDQWTGYLKGGEEVVLVNLTPEGRIAFKLPDLTASVDVFYKTGVERKIRTVVDTLLLEPDLGRFMLCARASMPLRRNLHEIANVMVGRAPPQRVRYEGEDQVALGKPHYRSLAELVMANRVSRLP